MYCIKENSTIIEEIRKSASTIYELNLIERIDELNNLPCDAVLLNDNSVNIYSNETVLTTATTTATTGTTVSAKGYAVYRYIGEYPILKNWHAGLMNKGTMDALDPIIHIAGPGYMVRKTDEEGYLNGGEFFGYYRPETLLSEDERVQIIATARDMVEEDIPYSILTPIEYEYTSAGNIVDLHEITGIRCDGVVEYCYEYNGVRICGEDYNWNISINESDNRNRHSGTFSITPKSQARDYMVNMLGDVNADSVVNASDANFVLQYASKLVDFNSYQQFVGDVDGNGYINAVDAQLILKFASKTISIFPADPEA